VWGFLLIASAKATTLQKQVGFFNHRVVALVGDSGSERHTIVCCIKVFAQIILQPQHTDNPSVKELLQMHLNVALRNFHVIQVSDSFTDVLRVGSQCVVVVR